MRPHTIAVICALASVFAAWSGPVFAQDPPPRIPLFVIDLHATTTAFPDDPALAASRGLDPTELPGRGFGGDVAIHLFPFRYRAVTFGFGGRLMSTQARSNQGLDTLLPRPVTERFTYLGPQLSFNFGTGS